jgi:predicted Ser/Thr protein kinase
MDTKTEKLTKEQFDLKLLAIVHHLRPFEEIKIKKDEFGKPGRIVVLSSSTTILDYEEKTNQERY